MENLFFTIDFVVLDMKEDPDVPIILGRPLLNTTGALVDIRESKLTLRVGDEQEVLEYKMTFKRIMFKKRCSQLMKRMN